MVPVAGLPSLGVSYQGQGSVYQLERSVEPQHSPPLQPNNAESGGGVIPVYAPASDGGTSDELLLSSNSASVPKPNCIITRLVPVKRPASEPCPDPSVWTATMGTGYGQSSLRKGVQGLEWVANTQSPTRYINSAHTYFSNTVSGPVQIAGVMPTSPPYIVPFALSDLGDPDNGRLHLDCYVKVPKYAVIDIAAGVQSVDCTPLWSGTPCRFELHVTTIGGVTCP